jgi:RimJ/RimL family protein N-acetyltransferase
LVGGFVLLDNGALTGVVTYIVRGGVCEITSLDSMVEGCGVGTALIDAVVARARELGCKRLQLLTTNDNLNAIGFYQKRGFELVGVTLGAIDREREQKPSIPLIGQNGISTHHEVEFAMAFVVSVDYICNYFFLI